MARRSSTLLGREDLPSQASNDIVRSIFNSRNESGGDRSCGVDFDGDLTRVLVVYTGGTIGMKPGPQVCHLLILISFFKGYEPAPAYLEGLLRSLPMFHDKAFHEELIAHEHETKYDFRKFLVTPPSVYGQHISYEILEASPLLDSACMSMGDWGRIASIIGTNYSNYDAFLVLHGTDTLAYTASALSFMLEHLGKTVLITGAQIPITEHLNDAHHNFLGALTICGHFVIPEVCIAHNPHI
jgi:lysophospholipase